MNELRTFRLSSGSHKSPDYGTCVMEAAAMISGEAFSDSAPCISPVVGAFCRAWNDGLPTDEDRDKLLQQFVYRLPGTVATNAIELQRSWMAFDWLVRECVAEFMSLSPALKHHADILRGLPEIGPHNFDMALPVVRAAGLAAELAARAAAGDAAGLAAGLAARAAAGDAAGLAAELAARAAAGDAAGLAAGDALKPSVAQLQESAVRLLDRMIRLTEPKETLPQSKGIECSSSLAESINPSVSATASKSW